MLPRPVPCTRQNRIQLGQSQKRCEFPSPSASSLYGLAGLLPPFPAWKDQLLGELSAAPTAPTRTQENRLEEGVWTSASVRLLSQRKEETYPLRLQ